MGSDRTPVASSGQNRAEAYSHMFEPREGKVKAIALSIAVVVHLVVLVLRFPEFKSKIEEPKKENVIVIKKYLPPPPRMVERTQVAKKQLTRKLPIPDPTPDEPEPIREPEPEIEPIALPADTEFIVGAPEATAPSGPLQAGAGGVTNPTLIHQTQPEYPELARTARIEGRVILQATCNKDGTVSEPIVVSCSRPGVGFEDAAKRAVRQWRYEPALRGDRPVDVYFTIVVTFSLN